MISASTVARAAAQVPALPDAPCARFAPDGGAVYVDDDAPAGGDGSGGAPLRSIAAALAQAADGGSVFVAAGTYPESLRVDAVTARLVGGFAGGSAAGYAAGDAGDFSCSAPEVNVTRVQAPGGDSVVVVSASPSTRVEGLYLSGGTGNVGEYATLGGGVLCVDSTITIARNVITGNVARGEMGQTLGGGIHLQGCAADVSGNVISGNTADRGGAIAVDGGSVRIRDNIVDSNRATGDHGGGIYAATSDIEITGNVVQGNEVGEELGYGWGGGIVVFGAGSRALLVGNTIRDNAAPSIGSGTYIDDGATATLRNELVVRNRCAAQGGSGVYVDGLDDVGSTVAIENSTIASHDCPAEVGGNALFLERSSRVQLVNVILWGNAGDDTYTDDTSQISARYTLSQEALPGEGNLSADPLFVDPGAGDYHLRPGSPAIDAGDPATPFDAEPDPDGGRVDLGAYGGTAEAGGRSGGAEPGPEPSPDPGVAPGLAHAARFDRGSGNDPVAQAIGTSERLFADGAAQRVVLATADRFPDALAGAALAGDDGPILLTSGLGALDERVRDEIARVTAGDGVVLVLGGPAAVSDQAAAEAAAAAGNRACSAPFPTSCRYAGAAREHTAALISESVLAEHPGTTALVARRDDFADAITGGAYAAAAGVPILLTPPNTVNEQTRDFLVSHAIEEVIVLGGRAAVDEPTFQALPGSDKRRVAGAERTETAVRIAEQLWAPAGLGTGGRILVNVRAPQGWQTALSAAVASALFDAPQLGVETPPAGLSPATVAHVRTHPEPIEAFGGTDLVSDEQLEEAAASPAA